jgi:hypothetical protein
LLLGKESNVDDTYYAQLSDNMNRLKAENAELHHEVNCLRQASEAREKCLRVAVEEDSLVVTLAYGSEVEEREIALLIAQTLYTLMETGKAIEEESTC